MSKDFEYDPESGSFRFDEGSEKTKKKNDVDVGGWILIAALFAFGGPSASSRSSPSSRTSRKR